MSNSSSSAAISKEEIEAWCVVYGIEGSITVIANIVAILVFLLTPSLHKRTYYMLISLAFADLLVGAMAVPFFIYIIGAFYDLWAYQQDPGHINEAQTVIEVFTSYASIYSLTVIALERMAAIWFPWKHPLEPKASYISAIIVTWLMAVMTSILIIFYRKKDPELRTGIFLTIMVLLSLCIVITFTCYALISYKLCSNRDHSPNIRDHRETKLAVTLLAVSIIFIVTWLPFQVMNFIFFYNPKVEISYHSVYIAKLLHYFNSLVNPFIYVFRMTDFRSGLKKLCCCGPPEPPKTNQPQGAWHVKGYDGPLNDAIADDVNGVTMTTVSQI